jgi:hypothetical protein
MQIDLIPTLIDQYRLAAVRQIARVVGRGARRR